MSSPGALICDTSGLLAAADSADPNHAGAAAVLAAASGPLVLSPLVIAELDYLLRARLSANAARALADDVADGAYEVASLAASDVAACVAVDRTYADLGLGLTDSHLVVLADAYETNQILSLDERHLRAVHPLRGRRSFRLLPADRVTHS